MDHNDGQLSIVGLKLVAPNLGFDSVAALLAVVARFMGLQGQRIDHSPVKVKNHRCLHTFISLLRVNCKRSFNWHCSQGHGCVPLQYNTLQLIQKVFDQTEC